MSTHRVWCLVDAGIYRKYSNCSTRIFASISKIRIVIYIVYEIFLSHFNVIIFYRNISHGSLLNFSLFRLSNPHFPMSATILSSIWITKPQLCPIWFISKFLSWISWSSLANVHWVFFCIFNGKQMWAIISNPLNKIPNAFREKCFKHDFGGDFKQDCINKICHDKCFHRHDILTA